MYDGCRRTKLLTSRFGKFLILLALLCLVPVAVHADGGCDPLYMKSLRGRAKMEALREVAHNKNLIYKADSVMEYSCLFSHYANMEAHYTNDQPAYTTAVNNLVGNPMYNFIGNNFGHTYIGGHYPKEDFYAPSAPYFCDAMARMWEYARCINMLQYNAGPTNANNTNGPDGKPSPVPGSENIYDFKWYESNDPRKYPAEYQSCSPIIQDVDLKSAFRGLQDTWLVDDTAAKEDTAYGTDPVETYFKLTRWDVDGGDKCGDPIPTGLTIYRGAGKTATSSPELVCAKPGCTLIGKECQKD